MGNPWMPGCIVDPGRNAGYNSGRNRMEMVKIHATAGNDSYSICKNGGLCQWLVPYDGPPWQFAEADAICWDSGPWNDEGPGIEIERPVTGGEIRPGLSEFRPCSASQTEWTGKIFHWLHTEWGVPLELYFGPRFGAFGWRGFANHGDLDNQRTDGITREEWNAMIGGDSGTAPVVPLLPKGEAMWCAYIPESNWVDVWYETVIVDGFTNTNPNMFGVGPQLQGYLDRGAGLTLYRNAADYTKPGGVRARLLAK